VNSQILPLSKNAFNYLLSSTTLLGRVCFYVFLCSVLSVLGGVYVMTVRQVCVVGRFLVVAAFVVICGFVVVTRSMLMMFSCLPVMMGCSL
jgi:hypothetical protein